MRRLETSRPPLGSAQVVPMPNLLMRLLGVAALVLGLTGLTAGFGERRAAHEQTALPLVLHAGEVARTRFRTSGRYLLNVSVEFLRERGVPTEKLDELTHSKDGPLDVGWRVRQKGVELASGGSRQERLGFFGAQDRQGVIVGRFKPPTAGTYEIETSVNRTLSGLEAAKPTLRVTTNHADAKRAGFRATACTLIGVVLFGLGGLLLTLAFRNSP